jgi:hypothetical protein
MWVKAYDSSRSPAHWLDLIRPGEHCVFVLDGKGRQPMGSEGRPFAEGEASLEIAADYAKAIAFAEDVVRRHPSLCCQIYDHEGEVGEPLVTIYEATVATRFIGPAYIRHHLFAGLVLSLAAIFSVAYGGPMWGGVLALYLVLFGGTLLALGIFAFMKEHHIEDAHYMFIGTRKPTHAPAAGSSMTRGYRLRHPASSR